MHGQQNIKESPLTFMSHDSEEAVVHWLRHHLTEFFEERYADVCISGRAETERDGTRTETRFGFPAKRTSPFISAGVSVQSAAGSRGVRISGSNAG